MTIHKGNILQKYWRAWCLRRWGMHRGSGQRRQLVWWGDCLPWANKWISWGWWGPSFLQLCDLQTWKGECLERTLRCDLTDICILIHTLKPWILCMYVQIYSYINSYRCLYLYTCMHFLVCRWPGSDNILIVVVNTPSSQILVSNHHSPLIWTRASWKSGCF